MSFADKHKSLMAPRLYPHFPDTDFSPNRLYACRLLARYIDDVQTVSMPPHLYFRLFMPEHIADMRRRARRARKAAMLLLFFTHG